MTSLGRFSVLLALCQIFASSSALPADSTSSEVHAEILREIEEDLERSQEQDQWAEPLTEEEFNAAVELDDETEDEEEEGGKAAMNSGKSEGDIVREGETGSTSGVSQNAHTRVPKWENQKIAYKLTNDFSGNERKIIARAFQHYHDHTCLKFVGQTNELYYLKFFKGNGCYSYIGRVAPRGQELSLGKGCVHAGTAMHEIMHALGFGHEQSRSDRDKHVRILLDNVKKGMEHNFKKLQPHQEDTLGAPYDTCSIMHYGTDYFTKNGRPTIEVIQRGSCRIGMSENFSDIDLKKINTLYKCKGYPTTTKTTYPPANCNGGDDCCTDSNPCAISEGDCDSFSDCQGDLDCGVNNCPRLHSSFEPEDDCCFVPTKTGCDGGNSCCTETNKCWVGEGDCDDNHDCQEGLQCGNANCHWDQDNCGFFCVKDDCCARY